MCPAWLCEGSWGRSDPTLILGSVLPPPSYNLLPRIIEAKYLDAMDAEH